MHFVFLCRQSDGNRNVRLCRSCVICGEWDGWWTVSYTHLTSTTLAELGYTGGDGKINLTKGDGTTTSIEAVSYTHLDVYKRQIQDLNLQIMKVEAGGIETAMTLRLSLIHILGEHCRKGKPAHQLWDGIAPETVSYTHLVYKRQG